MKKLLLVLSFMVSPLVAMGEGYQGSTMMEIYDKYSEYQKALIDYSDVPEGTYDDLFQRMAKDPLWQKRGRFFEVLLELLKKQVRKDENAQEVMDDIEITGMLLGIREQLEEVDDPKHMLMSTRRLLEETAKIYCRSRKLLEPESSLAEGGVASLLCVVRKVLALDEGTPEVMKQQS